jgi:hypothetical protein
VTDKNRYQVVAGSESAHCCFEATVIDTDNPEWKSSFDGVQHYKSICECMSIDDANKIADALNR